MALVDSSRDHAVRASIARLFHAVARWVADELARRQRRSALRDLMFAPEHRLRDLGISREELIRAIKRR